MNKQGQEQLDSLTGLRFLAALMVFANHVFFSFPGLGDYWGCHVLEPLGNAGVCFFYVLSGFILTYVYCSRSTTICRREFYLKRLARIWPLHVVTMLIVLFCVVSLRHQLKQPQGLAQIVGNTFLVHAWWPEYRWAFSINGPSWSLSNEAFFYLLFPWLVMGRVAFRQKFIAYILFGIVAIAGLSFVPDTVLSESSVKCIIHTNPLLRTFDFMTGMAFGFLYLRLRQKNAPSNAKPSDQGFGSSLLATLMHLFTLFGSLVFYLCVCQKFDKSGVFYIPSLGAGNHWLVFSGAAPAFAIAIFAFASISSWVSKIFSAKVMVYLGEISFAFYLIHQPIIVYLSRQELATSSNALTWLSVSALLLSFAAAMVLHHIVELPSRAGLIQMFSTAASIETKPKRGWLARCGTWLAEYVIGAWRLFASLKILALLGFVIAGYLFANAGIFNFRDASLIQEVVRQSEDRFKDVRFDQDAVLQGVKIDPHDDGSYLIQMVWKLKAGRRPVRFLHVVSSSGELLRQGNANRQLFSRVTGNEIVLDRIVVSKGELDSAAMLAIGFYGPERKSAPIVNPLPGHPTHRLPILHIDPKARR